MSAPGAYYNEIDPYCAAWLRNLIAKGHIAPGDVDERDIQDVRPDDLCGYTQCHFFAGVGVWSSALRLAGWPDDRSVWTGSCPCQPFSAAGKGIGFADERHLWPAWHHLISERRPNVVLGEQVASADGLGWLDLVQSDMEATNYPFAAVDLCAAGVGAPHIRQRLWFVGYADGTRLSTRQRVTVVGARRGKQGRAIEQPGRAFGGMANAESNRYERARQFSESARRDGASYGSTIVGMADANSDRCNTSPGRSVHNAKYNAEPCRGIDEIIAGPTNGHWRDADWILCWDEKWRPVEPGTFPLAHGAASRVGRLRAYGNAINREVAKTFIEAVMVAA